MVTVKLACRNIIILQVRESVSTRRSQVTVLVELAHDYSLLLLTALIHLMRTFIEEALCVWNLSYDAQKQRAMCYSAGIVGRSRIKHVTQ